MSVGQLTTKPLPVRGYLLLLNVEQRGGAGEVTVALLDEQAAELPGFGFADSIPLATDAIRAPVQWRTQADLSTLRDKTVRIALRLRGPAIVYALAIHENLRRSHRGSSYMKKFANQLSCCCRYLAPIHEGTARAKYIDSLVRFDREFLRCKSRLG